MYDLASGDIIRKPDEEQLLPPLEPLPGPPHTARLVLVVRG